MFILVGERWQNRERKKSKTGRGRHSDQQQPSTELVNGPVNRQLLAQLTGRAKPLWKTEAELLEAEQTAQAERSRHTAEEHAAAVSLYRQIRNGQQ